MKRVTKNLVAVFVVAVTASVFAGGIGLMKPGVSANAEEAASEFRVKGASVRVVDDTYGPAVRFHVEMSKAEYQTYSVATDGVQTGTLVLPESKLTGTLTLNTPEVCNIVTKDAQTNVWFENENGNMESIAYISDIPDTDYSTELAVVGYVTTTSGTTYTAQVNDISLAWVAYKEYTSGNPVIQDEAKRASLMAAYATFDVSFNDGTAQKVQYGQKLTAPEAEEKAGEKFVGWYNQAGTSEWDFDGNTVKGNVKLYAKYEAKAQNEIAMTVEDTTCGVAPVVQSITATSDADKVTYAYYDEQGNEVQIGDLTEGTYTIKATIAENADYLAGEQSATFTVSHKYDHWDVSSDRYDYKACNCGTLDKTQFYKKSVYALNQELWMTDTSFSISLDGCSEYESVVGIQLGSYNLGTDIAALNISEALKADTVNHGKQTIVVTVKCADESEHEIAVPVTLITKAIASSDDFKALQITAENKSVYGYYVMTADVSANQAAYSDWDQTTGFFGTLDGAGHTITAPANNIYGIFAIIRNAVIKNVTFKDNWRSGYQNYTWLAKGILHSLFENVTFTYVAGNTQASVGEGYGWICSVEFSNNTLKNVTVNDTQGYGSLFGCKFSGNVFDNVVINGTYTEMGHSPEGTSVSYDEVTKAAAVEKVTLEGRQDFVLEGGAVSVIDLGGYADATVISVKTSTGFELNGLSSSLATTAFREAKQSHGEQNFIVVVVTGEGKTVEITVPVTVITKVISTMAELQDTVKHTSGKDDIYGYYTLANDVSWREEGFEAVVASGGWSGDKAFRGTLDGRGYTITMKSSAASYGLFGTINGATIKNVTIKDEWYSGGYTPILARNAYNMTLDNVRIMIVGGNAASAGTTDNTPLVGNTMQSCVLKNVTFTSSVSLVNVFATQSGNTFENVAVSAPSIDGFSTGVTVADAPEGVTITQTAEET